MHFHAVAETKQDWVLVQKRNISERSKHNILIFLEEVHFHFLYFLKIALEHISKGLILQKALKIKKI